MSIRYIGSKARIANIISDYIGSPSGGRFIDAFCGTGVIAESAAKLGWPVWLNDHLTSAGIISTARLISEEEIAFKAQKGYIKAIDTLNSLKPKKGFIWREYSPASALFTNVERRYFTEKNAAKIDAIRDQISTWRSEGRLSNLEEQLLIADLLIAINRIANTAGTFGCFLSRWTTQSSSNLRLVARDLKLKKTNLKVTAYDVASLEVNCNDLVYLDPPYTKRQYASYYHILETVSIGDEPKVKGVSGLRPWHDKASDYCYKTKALKSLSDLISNMNADRILLSYSEEGHIPINDLHQQLESIGSITTHPLKNIGRYRPNKAASAKHSSVKEYLIEIEKEQQQKVMGKVA